MTLAPEPGNTQAERETDVPTESAPEASPEASGPIASDPAPNESPRSDPLVTGLEGEGTPAESAIYRRSQHR